MGGARARSVAGQIISITVNIGTLALRITKTFINSAYNDAGELVFENFSLLDNSVSYPKLLFTAAYHAAHTEGSTLFASVCLLGSCLIVFTIMIHLNRNYITWARIRILGMAILMALGVGLLRYGMLIPLDHAWHTVAVPSIICSLVWLEVALLICTQIKEDGGNKHLLRDLLMELGETPISIYRCVHLIQKKQRYPLGCTKDSSFVGERPANANQSLLDRLARVQGRRHIQGSRMAYEDASTFRQGRRAQGS